MSRWTDLDTELAAVPQAMRNLANEPLAVASYLYNRATAYMGADHGGVVIKLIEVALTTARREGWRAALERAAQEAETRAERHEGSVGGSTIDGLHAAMADGYRGLARRLRALPDDPPA